MTSSANSRLVEVMRGVAAAVIQLAEQRPENDRQAPLHFRATNTWSGGRKGATPTDWRSFVPPPPVADRRDPVIGKSHALSTTLPQCLHAFELSRSPDVVIALNRATVQGDYEFRVGVLRTRGPDS